MKTIRVALLIMALACSTYAGEIPYDIRVAGNIPNDVAAAGEIPYDIALLNLLLILL